MVYNLHLMYPITEKQILREDYLLIKLRASHLKHAKAGQYAIVQYTELSEPLPLSILDVEGEEATFLIKVVGRSTLELKEEAESVFYVAGPLGIPFPAKHYGKVVFFTKDWGVSPAINIANHLRKENNRLELYHMSEDGFLPLKERLESVFDKVEILEKVIQVNADLLVSAGSNRLSREVELINRGTKHIAMVNTHILDGVGLCLVCRVLVDGNLRLACTDGPWFPADKVDWENLIGREDLFLEQEKLALEEYKKILKRKELRKTSAEV
ncbi:iron-sulfur cluster-binding protein [Thermocrinis sp.]